MDLMREAGDETRVGFRTPWEAALPHNSGLAVSYDLAIWEGPRPEGDICALRTYQDLVKRWHGPDMISDLQDRRREKKTSTDPTPPIVAYVEALLTQWPDITTEEGADSPWSDGPLINNAIGPFLYLGLVFSQAEEASDFVARVAAAHGLVCFDPQLQRLRP